MSALDRKLLRDLWQIRGQALAIALVIASGVATYIMFVATLASLQQTRDAFYRDYRFADVFASVKRAPISLAKRIADIPGVEQVVTRVGAWVKLDIPGFTEPVSGRLISVPDGRQPLLNQLYIKEGRLVEPGAADEVVVGKVFAEAHGFKPGDTLPAIINGHRKVLTIVGLGLSPEYILQESPGGLFPDPERFGVLWMGRSSLANALDMDGAFNNVVLKLARGAHPGDVIRRLDVLLRPYGSVGAYGRDDQFSYRALSNEFATIETLARVFPLIFLGVATFMLNVVVSRLVATQRELIAALKAFGYSNRAIAIHYLKLILLIVVLGAVAGLAVSFWLTDAYGAIYTDFFHFPRFIRASPLAGALFATLVAMVAAIFGTLLAIRKAARLPPAQAMRPEPPRIYREALIERVGLKRVLSESIRMIARHIERTPIKSLLTVIGMALACGSMMVTSFIGDSFYYAVDALYKVAQRQDVTVVFNEPTSRRALYELRSLPGVEYVEGFRMVTVRLRHEHHSYRTVLRAIEPGARLYRLINRKLQVVKLPPAGVVLTDYLANRLGVGIGDHVTVEVLEGSQPVRQVPVTGVVGEFFGSFGYMDMTVLHRLLGEGDVFNGALLMVDHMQLSALYRILKERPQVVSTIGRDIEIRNFYERRGYTMLFTTTIATLLAAAIAFGIVYNTVRIALSERGRELASLRVLGLTRAEVSYILLGETALLTLLAIPLGFLLGRGLCAYLIGSLWSDQVRLPLVVRSDTYALAATVVLVSAVVSGLLVRRKIDHLDLVAVLKTNE